MPSKIHRFAMSCCGALPKILAASAWFALSTSGCGAAIGAATIADSQSATQVGVTGSFRGHPGSSEGLVLGAAATVVPKLQHDLAWKSWGEGAIGYAVVPLAHTNPVGFEATVGPAGGVVPVGLRHPFSLGWSFRLGLPYRVSRARSPWENDAVTQSLAYLVPEVALVQMFPLGPALDHGAINQLLFSISFRYDQWLAVMP